MKKSLLLLLCLVPLLCGCGSLYAQRREVEQLLVMETMGLDFAPGGVMLSLASADGGSAGGAVCCSAAGASIADAQERLQRSSLEEELFCGHLQHLLLGEDYARQGLDGFLATVCRSPDLRLDLPVYLILDGTAQEAMASAGDGSRSVSDLLSALEQGRDGARFSTAGAILRDLDRQGGALVRTLRLRRASEEGEEELLTLTPEGYGVLVDGRLQEKIGPEEAVAVELLTDTLRPTPLVLTDGAGRSVTVELQESVLRLEPLWEQGQLRGLDVTVQVRAAVLEIEGFPQAADERYRIALTARMETELSRRIGGVLRLSRSMGVDFLGLGSRIERLSPLRGRGLDGGLGPLLPELTISVTVQGELAHSNDIY